MPSTPIKFLDLAAIHDSIKPEIDSAISSAISGSRYILGPHVYQFEKEFADYVGARFCLGLGNGYDALVLALKALEIGAASRVIVPGQTFVATYLAICNCGAEPVPVDVNQTDGAIDPQLIEDAILAHRNVKAIMAVDLFGNPANYDAIGAVARKYDLSVISDAAQSHGAQLQGRPMGQWSDIQCWSFYPGKNLGALGDGGAITTNNPDWAGRIRRLRNYGGEQKYEHFDIGMNSRLDDLQAAILSAKLRHLNRWTEIRRVQAARYHAILGSAPVELLSPSAWADPAWHLYPIKANRRDALKDYLGSCGVESIVHYPIVAYRQPVFGERFGQNDLPQSNSWAACELSLPIGPHLSLGDIDRVATLVAEFKGF